MKKFLAVLFSVVFAFSAFSLAFAADEGVVSSFECPYCHQIITGTDKQYNDHIRYKCPALQDEPFVCPYEGCGAKFYNYNEYRRHVDDVCPFKYSAKKEDLSLKEKIVDFITNLDVKELLGKADKLLTKINLPKIVVKIIDLLEKAVVGLIGKIK